MVRINLLPIRTILRKRELKQFAFLAAGILLATLAVMLIAFLGFNMKINSLKAEENSLRAQLASLKKKNQEINKMKDEIARLQKQVNTIVIRTRSHWA